MKKIIIFVLLIIATAAGGYLYLSENLDNIVRDLIISETSKLTQSKVELNSVEIDVKQGRAQLNNFTLHNPKPFNSAYAIKIDEALLDIDPKTIFDEVVTIEEITIDEIDLIYEQGDKNSNFDQLVKNIKNQPEAAQANQSTNDASQSSTNQETLKTKAEKKFIIKKLNILDPEVEIAMTVLGDKLLDSNLPDIRMNNIGVKEGGVSTEKLSEILLKNIEEQLKRQISFSDIEKKLQSIELDIDDLEDLEDLKNQIEDLDELEDDVKSVIDQLEKIF